MELWSEGIDVFEILPSKVLHIPEIGEVKLTIETSQLDKHIYIELIDRVQVG